MTKGRKAEAAALLQQALSREAYDKNTAPLSANPAAALVVQAEIKQQREEAKRLLLQALISD